MTACQRDAGADGRDRLVVYSGRSQALVDGFVESYRVGAEGQVQVRYGRDAELLATLAEEGARSPAGLFWANTAGALGAAGNAGLLVALPDSLLQRPAAFVPSSGLWVPVTVRFRVLAYQPARIDAADLPASVMDLPGMPGLRGRVGWTPTYSSFQDFVTALRTLHGESAACSWLEDMRQLQPKAYPANAPMLEALAAGEIDVALTNHYYVLRALGTSPAGALPSIAIHHFAPGDVGNLALVTGAGLLETAESPEAALRFLEYLLSDEAQGRAVQSAHEYPVVPGVGVPAGTLSFDEALRLGPELDLERLRDLDETLRLLRDVGLL
jgi:iron(III) transport system substrate-binding protein